MIGSLNVSEMYVELIESLSLFVVVSHHKKI